MCDPFWFSRRVRVKMRRPAQPPVFFVKSCLLRRGAEDCPQAIRKGDDIYSHTLRRGFWLCGAGMRMAFLATGLKPSILRTLGPSLRLLCSVRRCDIPRQQDAYTSSARFRSAPLCQYGSTRTPLEFGRVDRRRIAHGLISARRKDRPKAVLFFFHRSVHASGIEPDRRNLFERLPQIQDIDYACSAGGIRSLTSSGSTVSGESGTGIFISTNRKRRLGNVELLIQKDLVVQVHARRSPMIRFCVKRNSFIVASRAGNCSISTSRHLTRKGRPQPKGQYSK